MLPVIPPRVAQTITLSVVFSTISSTSEMSFDFTFPRPMTKEEIAEVERLVNRAIEADVPVVCEEMTVEEAKKQGAIGLFTNKYGEKVKVYTMGDFSKEICGGPHAARTGELGRFKIVKEQSSSAGVRRIKAVLEYDGSPAEK